MSSSLANKDASLEIRDFKIQRGNGNENGQRERQREHLKKTIGFISKTTTLQVLQVFLHISLPFWQYYDVKIPNFVFYGERKQATTKFYFAF